MVPSSFVSKVPSTMGFGVEGGGGGGGGGGGAADDAAGLGVSPDHARSSARVCPSERSSELHELLDEACALELLDLGASVRVRPPV